MHGYDYNPELLCIARAGAGTNNIPVEECGEKGIVVFNTPGANAEAVKELVLCALLLSSRDIIGGIDWVKSIASKGEEVASLVEKGKSAYVGPEIYGKTLGVIGLGAIGAKIAHDAMALGMKVYGYDPYLSVDAAWRISSNVINAKEIETIWKNCDYITIHVPYLESTHHLVNACSLAMMKSGVRIINLARAELVNDDDMIEAIDNGKVACYVTDFPNAKTANVPKIIPIRISALRRLRARITAPSWQRLRLLISLKTAILPIPSTCRRRCLAAPTIRASASSIKISLI
jgi:D-3-phosphoglycerate dehydrogenase